MDDPAAGCTSHYQGARWRRAGFHRHSPNAATLPRPPGPGRHDAHGTARIAPYRRD